MKKLIILLFLFGIIGNAFAEDKPTPPPPSQTVKEEKKEPPVVIVHKPGRDLARKIRKKLGLE